MTYPRMIALNWLALLVGLAYSCQALPAHAELTLDLAGGYSQFLKTTAEGDYRQSGLPSTWDTRSLAYKVGLCYAFNERWSTCGGYVNFGTINQTAKFVGDEDYNPKGSQCVKNCATAPTYRITDAYHGGELTISRAWEHLYAKLGMAYLMHRFTINKEDGSGASNQHYGQFLSTVAGVGAKYGPFYAEVNAYMGLGGSNGFLGHDQGWPLSKEQVVAWFGVRLPLTW